MTQIYVSGGAEWLQVSLVKDLNRLGVAVDVINLYTDDIPGTKEARERLHKIGAEQVHFLGMRVHPPPWQIVSGIFRLRRILREGKYDIVETAGFTPAIIAAWATRGIRARHVFGLHQVMSKRRENRTVHKLLRLTARLCGATRYYAISDFAAKAWSEYSGTRPTLTRRVYNAIRQDAFEQVPDRARLRAELGIPSNSRIALYAGRLAADKGIETVLDALAPLLESENLYLLYVGRRDVFVPGTIETLARMEAKIQAAALGSRVRFLEFSAEMPRIMAASDLLVHPTTIEGFGLVLAEALAVGLPIVASDVEAIPEILAGSGARMIKPGDAQALAAAAQQMLAMSTAEREEGVRKGRARVEEFRLERRRDEMLGLFNDVLLGRF